MNILTETLNYLRKKYGPKYMAYPMDEVIVADYYFWLNKKIRKIH